MIRRLTLEGIGFEDFRFRGGALWINKSTKAEKLIQEYVKLGFHFTFDPYKKRWWTSEIITDKTIDQAKQNLEIQARLKAEKDRQAQEENELNKVSIIKKQLSFHGISYVDNCLIGGSMWIANNDNTYQMLASVFGKKKNPFTLDTSMNLWWYNSPITRRRRNAFRAELDKMEDGATSKRIFQITAQLHKYLSVKENSPGLFGATKIEVVNQQTKKARMLPIFQQNLKDILWEEALLCYLRFADVGSLGLRAMPESKMTTALDDTSAPPQLGETTEDIREKSSHPSIDSSLVSSPKDSEEYSPNHPDVSAVDPNEQIPSSNHSVAEIQMKTVQEKQDVKPDSTASVDPAELVSSRTPEDFRKWLEHHCPERDVDLVLTTLQETLAWARQNHLSNIRFYQTEPRTVSISVQRLLANQAFMKNAPVYQRFKAISTNLISWAESDPQTDHVEAVTKELKDKANERWLSILQDSFPDGYILKDFLGQFQAAAFWQERYGEDCPIQGEAIDAAMKAVGVVRDGRVFVKSEEDKQLITNICREINDILSCYTTVYRSCIYESYQEQLASISIYTEQVMTQQLLTEAKGSFYSVNQVFAKPGQFASVIQDARKVLREHGGPMPVDEVAKVLWFIPRDMVYHYLSVDDESLNIGNSTWMLAEHFPVTHEDAAKIGNMLDEYFLSNSYVQAFDLMSLLRDRLPGIADNLSGMTYQAVFNIVAYYLRDRFNFTKAIISPKGTSVDFTELFRSFAVERDTFTLTDLEALASELKLPIYWESTYAGGAVRVSKTEFVNKRLIHFDVDAIDTALADFCPGDYLPLMSVTSAMMMHLPSCGYRWNGYLLQSYVFGFSKVFRLSYSSFGKTGYYGAMVRRSCKTINNYGSLIERVLTDDDTWETTADALDLLVNNGYQAIRKYKGIDNVVAQARRNKLPNDGR